MISEISAELSCGQILFTLKQSKLNYVVRETPFSAHITIRKKFIKKNSDTTENYVDEQKVEGEASRVENNLEKENEDLKLKLGKAERISALHQFANEELEVKNESLNKDITSLEDSLEEAYLESRKLRKEVNELKNEKIKVVKASSVEQGTDYLKAETRIATI